MPGRYQSMFHCIMHHWRLGGSCASPFNWSGYDVCFPVDSFHRVPFVSLFLSMSLFCMVALSFASWLFPCNSGALAIVSPQSARLPMSFFFQTVNFVLILHHCSYVLHLSHFGGFIQLTNSQSHLLVSYGISSETIINSSTIEFHVMVRDNAVQLTSNIGHSMVITSGKQIEKWNAYDT